MSVEGESVSGGANQTFSRQGRANICAYNMIWCERQGRESTRTNESALTTDPIKMEKLVKRFKTHPCALDFDHSFCKATFIDLTNKEKKTKTIAKSRTTRRERSFFVLGTWQSSFHHQDLLMPYFENVYYSIKNILNTKFYVILLFRALRCTLPCASRENSF